MRRDHVAHPGGVLAPQMHHRLGRLHLHSRSREFQPVRPDPGQKPPHIGPHPVWHARNGRRRPHALHILDVACHGPLALALAARLRHGDLIAEKRQYLLPALAADEKPLLPISAASVTRTGIEIEVHFIVIRSDSSAYRILSAKKLRVGGDTKDTSC